MAYDFHYTPTGTGVISGKEVLEQTEDAINDLGNTAISGVQEALDKAEQALTNSENAVDDAQTALNTANNAEGVAIQAQTDVGNLSGTVTNIGNRVTTAEGNISNLQGRMTTAEGNIGNLQGRMTTAETNIGNLQTAVSTAQATANSAQQTATTARQQSYVLRYSSSSVTDNSTIAYSTLDNTDNVKSGDKVIDVDGKIFSVVSVDTANQTVTVGTALIDLAQDSDVVHKSGNETVGGIKNFTDDTYIKSLNFTDEVASPSSSSSSIMPLVTTVTYTDQTASKSARINLRITASGDKSLYPHENNQYALGLTSHKWSEVHGVTYYYGSSDVEFSNKFVTTDTDQTITGDKTWAYQQIWNVNCQRRIISTFEKGETPPSNYARNDYYTVKNGTTSYANALGVFGCSITTGNKVSTYFHALKNQAGVSTRTTFEVSYDTNTDQKEVSTNADFLPTSSGQGIGNSTSKWATINGLEPSALAMPDLANGIDISSYLTNAGTTTPSEYTPLVNGYICIKISADSPPFIRMYNDYGFDNTVYTERNEIGSTSGGTYTRFASLIFPANKNVKVYIIIMPSTFGIVSAKFYPCQGNV